VDAKPVVVAGAANGGDQVTRGEDAKQQLKEKHGEVTSAQPAE